MDVLALRAQNPSAPVCTVNPTVLTLSQSSQKSPLVDCMNPPPKMNPPPSLMPPSPPSHLYSSPNPLSIHLFLFIGLILYLMFILRMGYVIPYGIRNPFKLIFYFPYFNT